MNGFKSKLLGAVIYPGENAIFFYGGIFSQWYQRAFWVDTLFSFVSSAEEAMMLSKALLFDDQTSFNLIRKASGNPKEQKRLGRLVKNYDEAKWAEERLKIVTNINYDKFSKNEDLKELLLLTASMEIVEASPVDRIWGIGMCLGDPNLLDRKLWGQNLLGKAIVTARALIFDDEYKKKLTPIQTCDTTGLSK